MRLAFAYRNTAWVSLLLLSGGILESCNTVAGLNRKGEESMGGAAGDGDGDARTAIGGSRGDGDDVSPMGAAPGDGDEGDGDGDEGDGDASGGTGGQLGTGGMMVSGTGGEALGGAGPIVPPSCEDEVGDECGAGDSCCTSLWIPTENVRLGRTEADSQQQYLLDGPVNEVPETSVQVHGFYLDKYEVTVGRFRKFVEGYTGEALSPGVGSVHGDLATGWAFDYNQQIQASKADLIDNITCSDAYQNFSEEPLGREQFPINCIDWWTAYQFCIWDGGRLPTEAEWELAAAGPDYGLRYPWGDSEQGCNFAKLSCNGGQLVPVGSYPAGEGPYGHLDLAGSMAEWVLDRYGESTYQLWEDAPTDPVNPIYLASGTERVVRGSWFGEPLEESRVVIRGHRTPSQSLHGGGIRCAREGEPPN